LSNADRNIWNDHGVGTPVLKSDEVLGLNPATGPLHAPNPVHVPHILLGIVDNESLETQAPEMNDVAEH